MQVAGSVGPYGACLVERPPAEYHGNYVDGAVTIDELTAWHRPRVAALIDAGVDFLALETVPALAEARALLRLLHSTAPRQPAWLAFTCKVHLFLLYFSLFPQTFPQIYRSYRVLLGFTGLYLVLLGFT